MKVLLTAIGSRGDVQPMLALAIELRSLGHDAALCVAPNFGTWVESFGLECVPIGPDVRQRRRLPVQGKSGKPSEAQLRMLVRQSVRDAFLATLDAAHGADLIVAAGALQVAGRSIAESLGIPYVYVAYCPAALRSADHPPPQMRSRIHSQSLPRLANRLLWMRDARRWNARFRATINEERAALDLPPIDAVPPHVSTQRPWLAADRLLGPAASARALHVIQTGAWFLAEPSPLPDELERFLADGEPPIYFGFGSMRSSADTCRVLTRAARAVGRRAIVAQGWAELTPVDAGDDCISIGEVSHERLFPRVAAIVHHGGAGTTAAAARSGRPQVVIPHLYDQYFWAHRVQALGIGAAGPRAAQLGVNGLVRALRRGLEPERAERARKVAPCIEPHGARIAAERLIREFDASRSRCGSAAQIGPTGAGPLADASGTPCSQPASAGRSQLTSQAMPNRSTTMP